MILLRALCVVVLVSGTLVAQAAMQLERWTYAHMESLRSKVLSACLQAEPDDLASVAALLAEDGFDTGFVSVLASLALLRGQHADQSFVNRASLFPIVLPRVVDLDLGQSIHCTMYAPRRLDPLGHVDFRMTLEDDGGATLATTVLDERTSLEELLRFRPTTELSLEGKEAGGYWLRVATRLDGKEPRPWDVSVDTRFQIFTGYKKRADALEDRMRSIDPASLEARDRAVLAGAWWQVGYTMSGEPAVPGADPVAALLRMEAILANLQTDKPALYGLSGRMTIALPVTGTLGDVIDAAHLAEVSLALPDLDDAESVRPLILFVGGRPAWTPTHRPTTPKTRRPEWLLDQLRRAGFDQAGQYHLAVMESAGRFRNATEAVTRVVHELTEILPVVKSKVILVGEREGAWAVGRAAIQDRSLCSGLVLVTGGAMARKDVAHLAGLPILAILGQGHHGNRGLQYVQTHAQDLGYEDAVTLLPAEGKPWPLALGLSVEELTRFADAVLAR